MASKYLAVVKQYNAAWIDFDVEGQALYNQNSINMRNQAIKILLSQVPAGSLRVSYTLPVTPNGLDGAGLNVIKNANSNGLKIDIVNIMAMDYGGWISDMGATAISASQGTWNQVRNLGVRGLGVTPMIGKNDIEGEVFSISNAQNLLNWAKNNAFVKWIGMWSTNRDYSGGSGVSQYDRQFTNIFQGFK